MGMDLEKIEQAVYMILEAIGEDPDREGLIDTPKRVARMYAEVFSGLHQDPSQHFNVQFTEEEHEEMVIVKDIPVYSMCEHHLVPFYGKAHVAYIPRKGKITGLSKFARVVEGFAHRPQLQERLTSQIANAVMDELDPLGVVVVIEAEHMCMTMRGVKKAGSQTLTSAVRGVFKTNDSTRSEAFSMIRGHKR
ncbi:MULTISPECIES: GTP cyclohydrolase I FolE [unclassified Desulfosporosinus]|uniref:GTP cyclohydrolase I FolE n=1 Tax=unclassified Desulfosporosinus TaxID=2633794 RepID=UPI0002E773C8|nr:MULTISPECIES: GTP cyclohydrolase I FolE [unclassified Desulfosporosinus]ODA40582.1 GTP cyclohydrolase I, type 1 [Desulfosporosinus sp. BG]